MDCTQSTSAEKLRHRIEEMKKALSRKERKLRKLERAAQAKQHIRRKHEDNDKTECQDEEILPHKEISFDSNLSVRSFYEESDLCKQKQHASWSACKTPYVGKQKESEKISKSSTNSDKLCCVTPKNLPVKYDVPKSYSCTHLKNNPILKNNQTFQQEGAELLTKSLMYSPVNDILNSNMNTLNTCGNLFNKFDSNKAVEDINVLNHSIENSTKSCLSSSIEDMHKNKNMQCYNQYKNNNDQNETYVQLHKDQNICPKINLPISLPSFPNPNDIGCELKELKSPLNNSYEEMRRKFASSTPNSETKLLLSTNIIPIQSMPNDILEPSTKTNINNSSQLERNTSLNIVNDVSGESPQISFKNSCSKQSDCAIANKKSSIDKSYKKLNGSIYYEPKSYIKSKKRLSWHGNTDLKELQTTLDESHITKISVENDNFINEFINSQSLRTSTRHSSRLLKKKSSLTCAKISESFIDETQFKQKIDSTLLLDFTPRQNSSDVLSKNMTSYNENINLIFETLISSSNLHKQSDFILPVENFSTLNLEALRKKCQDYNIGNLEANSSASSHKNDESVSVSHLANTSEGYCLKEKKKVPVNNFTTTALSEDNDKNQSVSDDLSIIHETSPIKKANSLQTNDIECGILSPPLQNMEFYSTGTKQNKENVCLVESAIEVPTVCNNTTNVEKKYNSKVLEENIKNTLSEDISFISHVYPTKEMEGKGCNSEECFSSQSLLEDLNATYSDLAPYNIGNLSNSSQAHDGCYFVEKEISSKSEFIKDSEEQLEVAHMNIPAPKCVSYLDQNEINISKNNYQLSLRKSSNSQLVHFTESKSAISEISGSGKPDVNIKNEAIFAENSEVLLGKEDRNLNSELTNALNNHNISYQEENYSFSNKMQNFSTECDSMRAQSSLNIPQNLTCETQQLPVVQRCNNSHSVMQPLEHENDCSPNCVLSPPKKQLSLKSPHSQSCIISVLKTVNFAGCLKVPLQECIKELHTGFLNLHGLSQKIIVIQCNSSLHIWLQDSQQKWQLKSTYTTNVESFICQSCILQTGNGICLLVVSEMETDLVFLLYNCNEENFQEFKWKLFDNLDVKKYLLCGLKGLCCASSQIHLHKTALHIHYVSFSDSVSIPNHHSVLLGEICDTVNSFSMIEGLPQALLVYCQTTLYFWNYLTRRLIRKVVLHPETFPISNTCLHVVSEKGLLFLVLIDTKNMPTFGIFLAVNPITGHWDILHNYALSLHDNHNLQGVQRISAATVCGQSLIVSFDTGIVLWSLVTGEQIAVLEMDCSKITSVVGDADTLLLGLASGCAHIYTIHM